MAKEIYTPRGIRNPKLLKEFGQNGRYKSLLEIVANDPDLDLQIRSDYVNIYYRGHNLAKIESPNGAVQFSEFYFLRKDMIPDVPGIDGKHHVNVKGDKKRNIPQQTEIITKLREKRDDLKSIFKKGDYKTYIAKAKNQMDLWLSDFPKPEREEQHKIVKSNTQPGAEFTIIDIEFQTSVLAPYAYTPESPKDSRKSTRLDIIAVDKQGQLYVIELKKGCGACEGKSGLADHLKSFNNSVGRAPKEFLKDMAFLLKQKQEFGIIKDASLKIDESKDPCFVFGYAPNKDNTETIGQFEELCRNEKVGSVPILECKSDHTLTLYKA